MALSAKHLIICETPLNFNMPALMLGNDTDCVFMDWQPQDGVRVHVVALDGSGVSGCVKIMVAGWAAGKCAGPMCVWQPQDGVRVHVVALNGSRVSGWVV